MPQNAGKKCDRPLRAGERSADTGTVTANARKFFTAVTALFVAGPSLGTLLGFGPMGYHAGTELVLRMGAMLLATSMLALVVGLAGYLYYVNVIAPAPRLERARVRTHP